MKVVMRLFLAVLMLLVFQQSDAPRVRLLLRDENNSGVANVTLNLRTETSGTIHLTTNANGVALSQAFAGQAVWLTGGQRANGRVLVADSYPAESGFRLVLIPNQVRDVLLRLDGDNIVLDPDMIFSPGDPGEIAPSTPPQLAATVVPLSAASRSNSNFGGDTAPTSTVPAENRSALWVVLALLVVGTILSILALVVGLARRRQA